MDMPDPNVKHHLFNDQQVNATKQADHLSPSHRIQKIPLHPIMSNTNEDDDQQQGRRTTTKD